MLRRIAGPLLIAVAMTMSACADLEKVVRQQPQSGTSAVSGGAAANLLIGQNRESLVRQRGHPDQVFDIGGRREAYVYSKRQGSECTHAYVVNADGRIVNYYCR